MQRGFVGESFERGGEHDVRDFVERMLEELRRVEICAGRAASCSLNRFLKLISEWPPLTYFKLLSGYRLYVGIDSDRGASMLS